MAKDARDGTREMIAGMLENLGSEAMDGLSLDDLKDAMSHPLAAATVAELMPLEAASVQPGQPAPDFTLPWLPGGGGEEGQSVTLSERWRERPVALIFGSYT
jgi:hypothetical protein